MKAVDNTLYSYLNTRSAFHSCDLYTIKLADSSVYHLSNYDIDVTFENVIYQHRPFKFQRSQIALNGSPNVDTLTVTVYCSPNDMLGDIPFMKAVHDGRLEDGVLTLKRAYFEDGVCVGALTLFSGRIEVNSAGGLAAKLNVKSVLQGLAAPIPVRVFVGQASYANNNGTVTTSSTTETNMLIPLKPSMNVLLQV